jgi:hypothetical protein
MSSFYKNRTGRKNKSFLGVGSSGKRRDVGKG